jgi:hypothetical protein
MFETMTGAELAAALEAAGTAASDASVAAPDSDASTGSTGAVGDGLERLIDELTAL